jgi:hypothetical protein
VVLGQKLGVQIMSAIAMWAVHFKNTAVITLVKEQAKRANSDSAIRYSLYKTGMTVEQYVAACEKKGFKSRVAMSDIIWDSDRGFITLAGFKPVGESLPVKTKTEAKPAKEPEAKKGRSVAGVPTPSARAEQPSA